MYVAAIEGLTSGTKILLPIRSIVLRVGVLSRATIISRRLDRVFRSILDIRKALSYNEEKKKLHDEDTKGDRDGRNERAQRNTTELLSLCERLTKRLVHGDGVV